MIIGYLDPWGSFMNPTNLGVIGLGCLATKRRRELSGTRV